VDLSSDRLLMMMMSTPTQNEILVVQVLIEYQQFQDFKSKKSAFCKLNTFVTFYGPWNEWQLFCYTQLITFLLPSRILFTAR
jgi:hypothetical protein